MTPLVIAILTASLLGSAHCAGMCGAFLLFAVDPGAERPANRLALNVAYNTGRLITYVVLGMIAGCVGSAVNLGGSELGLRHAAGFLAGAMMVAFGLVALLRACGVALPRAPLPPALTGLAVRGHRLADRLPVLARAGAVGLLTTLLPCGWLYAFVITAAGTGGPLRGAVVMGVFWLGTLPIMMTLGLGLQALAGPVRRKLPLATSILVTAVGLWTLAGRFRHTEAFTPPDLRVHDAADRVRSLDPADCPLCK